LIRRPREPGKGVIPVRTPPLNGPPSCQSKSWVCQRKLAWAGTATVTRAQGISLSR